jgi:Xaa-Pro dipeptidase
MHDACREALLAAEARLAPGATLGSVFDAQARVLDMAGFREERLHTCGYGLGATFPPTWVDWPFIHAGSSIKAREGMVLLLLVLLIDRRRGMAYGLGRTVLVTEGGCEPLSRLPLDPIVNV